MCVCVADCAVEKIFSKICGKQKLHRGGFFVIFGRNSDAVRGQKQQFCSSEKDLDGMWPKFDQMGPWIRSGL